MVVENGDDDDRFTIVVVVVVVVVVRVVEGTWGPLMVRNPRWGGEWGWRCCGC